MATFAIKAPTGEEYEIDAPDTASEADIMAFAQANHVSQAAPEAPLTLSSPQGKFNMAPTGMMQSTPGITIGGQTPNLQQAINAFPQEPQIPSGFEKYNAVERGMGNAVLGLTQLANTGNQNIDQQLLADTIGNSQQAGVGTGVGGALGEMAGDPRNYMLALGGTGLAGLAPRTAAGAVYGATDPVASADTNTQLQQRGVNAATNAAMFAGLPVAVNAAAPIVGDIGKTIAANAPQGLKNLVADEATNIQLPSKGAANLPPELRGLNPLVDANTSTMFNKKPNVLEVGKDTNNAISEAYNGAQKVVTEKYDVLRKNSVDINAADFNGRTDNIIKYLSDKVLPGSKEQAALTKIAEVRDALGTKATTSPILDAEGSPIVKAAKTPVINSNDLLDIKAAINSGLPVNKFLKAGDKTLLNYKTYVNNLLQRGAQAEPKFGSLLTDAEASYSDVARRFTKNKALAPIWQPEDHLGWQTGQLGDTTLSRMNTLLDNLNTEKAGTVRAVLNALPEEKATELARQVIIHAKKQAPSGAKVAAMQFLSKQPVGALKTVAASLVKTQPTPITTLAKNLKKMEPK